MAEDIIVAVDIRSTNATHPTERESFLSGVSTGLRISEHMLKNGISNVPTDILRFLNANMAKSVDVETLRRTFSPWSLRKALPDDCYIEEKYLIPAFSFSYIEGLLLGFDTPFEISLAYTRRVKGLYVDGLMDGYFYRVRSHIATLLA
jgi:hypothetical protein